MKKLAAITSTGIYFLSAAIIFAQTSIKIDAPTRKVGTTDVALGFSDLGAFITNVLELIFIFAVIAVLVMLVWGAFEWITSGGDKEAVGKARGRILNALIGLAVLAVAFALFKVAGSFLGFDTANLVIPTPPPASPTAAP